MPTLALMCYLKITGRKKKTTGKLGKISFRKTQHGLRLSESKRKGIWSIFWETAILVCSLPQWARGVLADFLVNWYGSQSQWFILFFKNKNLKSIFKILFHLSLPFSLWEAGIFILLVRWAIGFMVWRCSFKISQNNQPNIFLPFLDARNLWSPMPRFCN